MGLSKNAVVYSGYEVELVAISGCYAAEATDAEGASRSLDIAGNIDIHRRIDLLIDENNVEGRLVGVDARPGDAIRLGQIYHGPLARRSYTKGGN